VPATTPADGPAPDTQAPSVPAGLSATAGAGGVALAWSASSDDTGVAGYTIWRDGAQLATVAGTATAYADAAVAPATGYSYQVDAVDAAGNRSARSAPAAATTPGAGGPQTLVPVADAYTSEGAPTTRYGAATTLRVDATPLTRSYLRFSVSGLAAPATRATLRVYAASSHSAGHDVHAVADSAWEEGTITHASAPALGARVGSSRAATAGSWTSVDVTSLVTGNGPLTIGLSTASGTALSLASRESGANAAQLVIEP
jgi:chitodextrinase